MQDQKAPPLISPPQVIREKLARNVREGRLLRALLKVSIEANEASSNLSQGQRVPPGGGRDA